MLIHGGLGREERKSAEQRFKFDPVVEILIATDAAGEGINLQRAHLMVNYDLPWNPNRLEQRFGRIHRIGQKEVCHLWNLIARGTREGDVYYRLLEKLAEERQALGGQVFDVLGELKFDGKPLRELMIEAIRFGDRPEIRAWTTRVVDAALDRRHLQELLDKRALTHDSMDVSTVREIRIEMERAEARRLQPHFIASFFLHAFKLLGGTIHEREPDRFQISHVPATIRNRDRIIGRGAAVLHRYERITFEKELIDVQGKPLAAFVCPGHPLLDATIDLIDERYRDLLKRGVILVDETDLGNEPRLLVFLEHAIQDASMTAAGQRRVVSKRMQFVELDVKGDARSGGSAPYLDYRPLTETEQAALVDYSWPNWFWTELEAKVLEHAAAHLVPDHFDEIRKQKQERIDKTQAAVKERLTVEINYWDKRANELKEQELAGRVNAKLNSGLARLRAEELQRRLQKRLSELDNERRLSPSPPTITGGALIVPMGVLLARRASEGIPDFALNTRESERIAMAAAMEAETRLGHKPRDISKENRGYDIESVDGKTGRLRCIEVKGRIAGADVIFVTKNEILTALNEQENFILAIVLIDGAGTRIFYLRKPFAEKLDFADVGKMCSVKELLTRAE